MLGNTLVPHVTDLALGHLCVDVPLFSPKVLLPFPDATRVRLYDIIVIVRADCDEIGQVWLMVLQSILNRQINAVVIRDPMDGNLPPQSDGTESNSPDREPNDDGVAEELQSILDGAGVQEVLQ